METKTTETNGPASATVKSEIDERAIGPWLAARVAELNPCRDYFIHDFNISISSSGNFAVSCWKEDSGYAHACGFGATIAEAMNDLRAKIEPRLGLADRKRAAAAALLVEAQKIELAEHEKEISA